MSKKYYQNSIYFRRQLYKLRTFIENGELNLKEEDARIVDNFFDYILYALSIYEKPKEKSIAKIVLLK